MRLPLGRPSALASQDSSVQIDRIAAVGLTDRTPNGARPARLIDANDKSFRADLEYWPGKRKRVQLCAQLRRTGSPHSLLADVATYQCQ